MTKSYIVKDEKGVVRCWWGAQPADYRHYHDTEWGRPTCDDFKLFEKICLEGFQSGLSWHTILKKRENFRAAFAGFDFNIISNYDETNIEALMQNAGIVRNRKKIEATIHNATCALKLVEEFGSLATYIWQWEPQKRELHIGKGDYTLPIPSITETSKAFSKDLKKRGWKFFGPTTAYAFMQAVGMVNDHMKECHCYEDVEKLRAEFQRPQ